MNEFRPGFGGDASIDSTIERATRVGRSPGMQHHAPVDEGPAPFDLRALLGLARRQKWTILATTLLGVGLGAVYVSQVDRQYTATSLLVVDNRASQMLGLDTGLNTALGTNAVVSTEIEIIRSSSVLLRAAEALHLHQSPLVAAPSRLENLLNAVGVTPDEATAVPIEWNELTPIEQVNFARDLGGHLQVGQRGTANVISISATTISPATSAEWANAVATAYLEEQVDSKRRARDSAVIGLTQQVVNLTAQLRDIEQQIDDFLYNAIDDVGTPAARQVLAELRGEFGVLDQQRALMDQLNQALGRADANRIAELLADQNPTLLAERTTFQQQLAAETDAERAANIRRQLAELETEIQTAAQARTQALETQLNAQQEVVNGLEDELDDVVLTQGLPMETTLALYQLQTDAETRRALYAAALGQLRGAEQELVVQDSRVIAQAVAPLSPSYPSVRSTLLMALLLAGAAGFGLAFLRENLLGGITSVDHLEQLSGLQVIAAVPKYKAQNKEEPETSIIQQPLSAFAEAIRRARVGIESMTAGQKVKLLVTSAAPGEGKTTMALAFARSMAMAGKSTILIDADLRHPSLAQHFNRDTDFGLIDYLLNGGNADTSQRFLIRENESGLTVMLGGKPSEIATDSLLMSQRFAAVMSYAAKQYDCIVIDSPPVGLVVDPQVIAREHATMALFVVKAEATTVRTVRAALRDLAMHSDIPIVGLLNQTPTGARYYGKYSAYYR